MIETKSSTTGQHDEEVWNKDAGAWNTVLRLILRIPHIKVDRAKFLKAQLSAYCDDEQVIKAIEDSPANAGISPKIIDRVAKSCIKIHTAIATGATVITALPGGLTGPAIAATVIGDVAQFYGHAFILAQKLAYLYGWPTIVGDEVDDETKFRITMLLGGMLGAEKALRAIDLVAKNFAGQVAKRLPRIALTKTAWYPLVKTTAKWIGISLTKNTFARGLGRIIPVVGGIICGGMTVIMMKKMAKQLQSHLKTLKFAQQGKTGLAK